MADFPDQSRDLHGPGDADVRPGGMPPHAEQARLGFASARADELAVRELYLLELAALSPDDAARRLEIHAYEAYCDAQAITREHDLEL